MSWLGDLFKGQKKVNLTPDISMPTQESLYFTPQLRDFAKKRIAGEDLGFGSDYLDKTTNPAIANIDANFKNKTLPLISSEASKRGLARSSIVTDQIGQADQQRNRDVNSLVAQFYQLNELQRKT